jgi:hypothetical protein
MSGNRSAINPEIVPWTFTVGLALEAHSRAVTVSRLPIQSSQS